MLPVAETASWLASLLLVLLPSRLTVGFMGPLGQSPDSRKGLSGPSVVGPPSPSLAFFVSLLVLGTSFTLSVFLGYKTFYYLEIFLLIFIRLMTHLFFRIQLESHLLKGHFPSPRPAVLSAPVPSLQPAGAPHTVPRGGDVLRAPPLGLGYCRDHEAGARSVF